MNISALLRHPTPSIEGATDELKRNGFIVLERKDDGPSPNQVIELTNELRAAVQAMWRNRSGSRYDRVRVLMVHWDADDLGVMDEIRMLGDVFTDLYHFDVEEYTIPSQAPDCSLKRRVIDFVEDASQHALLIFYYAGHAFLNPNRHDSPVWTANRRRDSPTLPSSGIQSLIEEADCDALLIYDSCHSADTAIMMDRSAQGVTEVIAACGFEAIAAEVGEHSFTKALVDVLAVSSEGLPFSISELHHRVLAQLQRWRPSPMKDTQGKFIRNQAGRLQFQPQRRRTPVHCILTTDRAKRSILLQPLIIHDTPGRVSAHVDRPTQETIPMQHALSEFSQMVDCNPEILITVKMETGDSNSIQRPDTSVWLEWLRSAPPEAREVQISVQQNEGEVRPSYDSRGAPLAPDDRNEKGLHEHIEWNIANSFTNVANRRPLPWILDGLPYSEGQQVSPHCDVTPLVSRAEPLSTDPTKRLQRKLPWDAVLVEQAVPLGRRFGSFQRGPWFPGEDAYLKELVESMSAVNWVRISQMMGPRSPKQCRERYHQKLKPSLNHNPISVEEGLEIERLVGEMGKRWPEIARRLKGRSDNAVKNWWNGSMNRRRHLILRRTPSQSPSILAVEPGSSSLVGGSAGVHGSWDISPNGRIDLSRLID